MTPLLDLVLQLVMFFMISANFVMEQTSVEVRLPEAISAKALDAKADTIIFLNINEKGQVVLPPVDREGDNDTLDNPAQVEGYMKRRAAAEKLKTRAEKPEATLILRIDKLCPFEKSYPIMKACRTAGYSNVQLRAIRFSGQE
jgi:biopolymer transport protein ExbD